MLVSLTREAMPAVVSIAIDASGPLKDVACGRSGVNLNTFEKPEELDFIEKLCGSKVESLLIEPLLNRYGRVPSENDNFSHCLSGHHVFIYFS